MPIFAGMSGVIQMYSIFCGIWMFSRKLENKDIGFFFFISTPYSLPFKLPDPSEIILQSLAFVGLSGAKFDSQT